MDRKWGGGSVGIFMADKPLIPYTRHEMTEEDIRAVVDALRAEWITTGPGIEEFETAFSRFIGCSHSIAVSSCTAALDLSFKVLALPQGSEVITTPLTFVATANALLYNNLVPVFCDIDPETFTVDASLIEEHITDKTRAIVSVDYAGQPCDYDALERICRDHRLTLIDDAAHALGATYNGRKIGTLAAMTSFSLHAAKNVTSGEGGVITTNDAMLARTLRMLRSHGIDRDPLTRAKEATWRYDMKALGYNYRMTDFQCALARSQLSRISDIIQRREKIVEFYNSSFKDVTAVRTPIVRSGVQSAWHLYTILLDGVDRDALYAFLRQRGIGANVHYIPVYKHSYYRQRFGVDDTAFPVTERVFSRILTLPLYQTMSHEDAQRVVNAVHEGVAQLAK